MKNDKLLYAMPMPNDDITRHKPIKPQKTAIFGKTSTLNEIGCS